MRPFPTASLSFLAHYDKERISTSAWRAIWPGFHLHFGAEHAARVIFRPSAISHRTICKVVKSPRCCFSLISRQTAAAGCERRVSERTNGRAGNLLIKHTEERGRKKKGTHTAKKRPYVLSRVWP
jgi:hypothetical protein